MAYISDIKEYVNNAINNGAEPELYAKTARISVRKGVVDEEIKTVMKDGHVETINHAKEGDMIAKNPNGEEYIIDATTFQKRYEVDPKNPEQYRPKGGVQQFIRLTEDIEFKAPWGEDMSIKKGGYLNITKRNAGDIYGIAKEEFHQTYAKCDKDSL